MWEFECHDWSTLQGFEKPKDISQLLERVFDSNNEEEWKGSLGLLEAYASDLGVPSEATKDVVACLVAIAIRTDGRKRSAVLGTLEELTCGRGVDEYTSEQVRWLRAAVRELGRALHTWVQLAEMASVEDAILCVELLAYCAVYVPDVESRVLRCLQLCVTERPELVEEVSALLGNINKVKRLLDERNLPP